MMKAYFRAAGLPQPTYLSRLAIHQPGP
jgi:hypothetical protein